MPCRHWLEMDGLAEAGRRSRFRPQRHPRRRLRGSTSRAPKLTLDQALDAAEHPGTRLCSLCSVAAELDSVLRVFEHGFGGSENDNRGTQ